MGVWVDVPTNRLLVDAEGVMGAVAEVVAKTEEAEKTTV